MAAISFRKGRQHEASREPGAEGPKGSASSLRLLRDGPVSPAYKGEAAAARRPRRAMGYTDT